MDDSCFIKNKAKIVGISKDIPSKPSLYKTLNLNKKIKDYRFDLSNFKKFNKILNIEKPDIIFHLAAQAIVSKSYQDPRTTWNSNLLLLKFVRDFEKTKIDV